MVSMRLYSAGSSRFTRHDISAVSGMAYHMKARPQPSISDGTQLGGAMDCGTVVVSVARAKEGRGGSPEQQRVLDMLRSRLSRYGVGPELVRIYMDWDLYVPVFRAAKMGIGISIYMIRSLSLDPRGSD